MKHWTTIFLIKYKNETWTKSMLGRKTPKDYFDQFEFCFDDPKNVDIFYRYVRIDDTVKLPKE